MTSRTQAPPPPCRFTCYVDTNVHVYMRLKKVRIQVGIVPLHPYLRAVLPLPRLHVPPLWAACPSKFRDGQAADGRRATSWPKGFFRLRPVYGIYSDRGFARGRSACRILYIPAHQTGVVSAQNSKHRPAVFFLDLILTAADRNSEIMHARCPTGSRIFCRFWIDILMNTD